MYTRIGMIYIPPVDGWQYNRMDWTSRKIQCRLSNNQKKLLKFLQFLNRDLYRLRHSHAYNIFLAPLLIRRARTHRERESLLDLPPILHHQKYSIL